MCYLGEAVASVLFRGSSGECYLGEGVVVSVLFRESSGKCVILGKQW